MLWAPSYLGAIQIGGYIASYPLRFTSAALIIAAVPDRSLREIGLRSSSLRARVFRAPHVGECPPVRQSGCQFL